MPSLNSVNAFFETLVAASAEYNEAVVGQLQLLDAVYKDVKPGAARFGQTINVFFPEIGPWQDQQNNDWDLEPINPLVVPMVFNTRPGKGILITDWDQYRTAVDIKDKFI